MSRRGIALILVVGVLAVLAVLGSAFTVLSRLERRAASQRVQGTQALLLTRSGIEDAQARLDLGQDAAYGGEDWDNSRTLSGIEGASEVYRPGILDRDACPVKQALRPSFFVKDPASPGADFLPAPKRILADGRERGYSGRLSTGTWAVKATPAGGFHVNGGDPFTISNPVSTSDFNTTLRRMLGILAEAIDREDGAADGNPVGRTDGENLIIKRPKTKRGWETFEQIRLLALGGSQPKLDALRDYLDLSAWTDKKVIGYTIDKRSGAVVTPFAGGGNKGYGLMSLVRTGNWMDGSLNLSGETRLCPGLESVPRFNCLTWNPAGPVCGRAPVDLAWARLHRPALIACLADLKGFFWREQGMDGQPTPAWNMLRGYCTMGYLQPASLSLSWAAASDDCRTVASELLGSTSELRTWEQWNAFCDALPLTGTSGLGQGKKDLLKANFNPNTDANKFNPTDSMLKSMDKSDIRIESTEFRLGPPRAWRVTACGRPSGRIPAARVLSMETSPDRVFTLTTQSELVAGNLGNPDRAGDESEFRAYGGSPYITRSNGIGKTFGHRLLDPTLIPGFSLQTYPEIPPEWTAGTFPRPPVWDGQLKQATVETEDGEYAPTATSMMFLNRWDDGWDADYSGGGGNLACIKEVPHYGTYQGTAGDSIWPDPDYSGTFDAANLFPDGAYLEFNLLAPFLGCAGSIPQYWAPGNMAPSRGTISYWFKPSYDATAHHDGYANNDYNNGASIRRHFDMTRWRYLPRPAPLPGAGTMELSSAVFRITGVGLEGLSATGFKSERAFGCFWESIFRWGQNSYDDPYDEQARSTPMRPTRRRWSLLTCFWDMMTPRSAGADAGKSSRIWMDRGRALVPEEQNSFWSYAGEFNKAIHPAEAPVDFTTQVDLSLGTYGMTPQDVRARPIFVLGDGNVATPALNGPDITMDELAIYDLGPATGGADDGQLLSGDMARKRYEAGRYYKESAYGGLKEPLGATRNAGEWFSAPVDLGDARVRSLSWTQIVPQGLKGIPLPPPAGTPVEDFDNPRDAMNNVLPPDGNDGRIVLELAHKDVEVPYAGGEDYAKDRWGLRIETLFTDSRGEKIDRRVSSPFRLHAVFQPNLADPLEKAILDPLTLDDVTVTYRPLSQEGFSAWREGE